MREIALSSACTEATASFEERADGRFCQRCQKMQYDLRAATKKQALAVLAQHGGRACARVRRGPGGAPRFAPEPPARGTLAGAAIALMLAACDEAPVERIEAPVAVSDDGLIDHSLDQSPQAEDHARHTHAHAPVRVLVDDEPRDFEGEIAEWHPEPDPDPPPPSAAPTTVPPASTAPPSSTPEGTH